MLYVVLRGILDNPPTARAYATLEKAKTPGIKRLIVILTGAAVVASSPSYVRFSVTALGVSGTIFKACALLLLECSLSSKHTEKHHHESEEPNGLLQKPVRSVQEVIEDDLCVVRDLSGVIAVASFLLCISFENLRRYAMVYRPQGGPITSQTAQLGPVKTIYYDWDLGADFLGVLLELLKAIAMLFMVSSAFQSRLHTKEK